MVIAEPDRLTIAPKKIVVKAPKAGYVSAIDAREVGLAAVDLGAGRTRSDQAIDHAVSIHIDAKPGERVAEGDALATLFVHDRKKAKNAAERVGAAFAVARRRPTVPELIIETIRR